MKNRPSHQNMDEKYRGETDAAAAGCLAVIILIGLVVLALCWVFGNHTIRWLSQIAILLTIITICILYLLVSRRSHQARLTIKK